MQKTSESQNWKTWVGGSSDFCEETVVPGDGHVHRPFFSPRPADTHGEERWLACRLLVIQEVITHCLGWKPGWAYVCENGGCKTFRWECKMHLKGAFCPDFEVCSSIQGCLGEV